MTNLRLMLSSLTLLGSVAMFGQGARNIVISEVMTSNTQSIEDEFGHREAWVELANTSYSTYNVRGMYLTTNPKVLDESLSAPQRISMMSVIPNGDDRTNLAARHYMMLFCNSNPAQGKLHLSLTVCGVGDATPGHDNKVQANAAKGKIEEFKDKDPHGFAMAIMAMGIVFLCLSLLWIFFTVFGMIMRHMDTAKKVVNQQPIKPITKTVAKTAEIGHKTSNLLQEGFDKKGIDMEVYMAVIGMALRQYEDDVHDVESGIITIKPKDTGWDDEYTQMTQLHDPFLPSTPQAPIIPTTPELH